ncbi:M23 family metallopeptidase [Pseudactinotalea sp.]|uniref:M23 family metallopeptidase n=1 Tax=Pseudactinotalea sp. TaxID=1926260 RepID=UPI003B3A32DB
MTALLRTIYRYRLVTLSVAVAIGVLSGITAELELPEAVRGPQRGLVFAAFAAAAITIAASAFARRQVVVPAPVPVAAPVHGSWMAINSPSSAVPSHGTRAYAQAYAIDLVSWPPQPHEKDGDDGGWVRPDAFPGFGAPVLAMIDGTVVTARGWRRDHRSRTSTAARAYLVLEGLVRMLAGPGWITGNHVVIRGDDGTYALVAHLRRGSLQVRRGDRVHAGQQLGDCGNSGNSSEPHVHAQLMDRASTWVAEGIPMTFSAVEVNLPDAADLPPGAEDFEPDRPDPAQRFPGIPANGEILVATPAVRPRTP